MLLTTHIPPPLYFLTTMSSFILTTPTITFSSLPLHHTALTTIEFHMSSLSRHHTTVTTAELYASSPPPPPSFTFPFPVRAQACERRIVRKIRKHLSE
ncbi:hypothetical protein QL285_092482 [Trifolium repens]|nr:hypothetical protein QL285_092482 [Trifolium repens]